MKQKKCKYIFIKGALVNAVREYARIMAQLIDPPAPGTP